jgi:hypothetical protein
MKITDFFRVITKIMGLLILVFPLHDIVINLFSEIFRPDREGFIITYLFIALFIVLYLSYCFIFKTDSVVKILKLEKGIADNIKTENIKKHDLLITAVLIIGGLCIVWSFSSVLLALLYTIVSKMNNNVMVFGNIEKDLFINIVDLIVGLILVTHAKKIASYLIKQS